MDDPFLEQSELLLSAAGVDSAFTQCAVVNVTEYLIPKIKSSNMLSPRAAGSLLDDIGGIYVEGSDDSIQIFAINIEPPAVPTTMINSEKVIVCMSSTIIEDSIMKSSHGTSSKCGVKYGSKELDEIVSNIGVQYGDSLDTDPPFSHTELFTGTADTQSTSIVGALTIDTPSTTKSSPMTDISDMKPASAELRFLSQASSKIVKKNDDKPTNVKCSVIKGSSLINTSIDVRHHLKVGSSVTIDGLQYQTAKNATDWTSSHIALESDWPGDSNFDSTLTITSPAHNGKSPVKKKNSVISVENTSIQNVSVEVDDFYESKSAVNSNHNSIDKNKILSKIIRESSSTGIVENDVKVNLSSKILKKSEQSGNFDNKNAFYVKLPLSPMKDKINYNEEAIESSRQLALNRVTGKIREDREQLKIDNENKLKNALLSQIVAEKKASELHIKSLERISLRKDVERANKHRLICLEEEQRACEEISNSKLDERTIKMDEMKKKTLGRYVRSNINY